MTDRPRWRRTLQAVAVGTVLVLGLGLPAGSAPRRGTTVTFAEQPAARPDFIFPLMPTRYFGPANAAQFQYLMYRPLYWFGSGDAPVLDESRSLADAPAYSRSNTVVTIDLHPYRWSNGEQVSARDVVFWLNLLHAEKANWGPYALGSNTIPDNIAAVSVLGPAQLSLTLTGPVNRFWYTDSELSQITPLPVAWDITAAGAAPGSGGCSAATYGTADALCSAVYTFLAMQAGYDPGNPDGPNRAIPGYARNPLWQVVDGPWRLATMDAAGNATLVTNPSYSGRRSGSVGRFVEVPFASGQDEEQALAAGRLSYGYLPLDEVGASTSDPGRAGPNNSDLGAYVLAPLMPWALNYVPYNFNSTGNGGTAGLLFGQLYIRQALQLLVDQRRIVADVAHGYGVPADGPVPALPKNTFVAPAARTTPYPYDPARARRLLAAHGWRIDPGGTDTCSRPGTGPGQCGGSAGRTIPEGTRLSFTLEYTAGSATLDAELRAEQASWRGAGIEVALRTAPYGSVLAAAASCRGGCSWELDDWGSGWLFSPTVYPLADALFASDAQFNAGSYTDPTNDANIAAAQTSAADLSSYQAYLARALPVLFEPTFDRLVEIAGSLRGATPPNAVLAVTPEDWSTSG